MNDKWEKLKGKIYPDTLDEQLKALATDETIRSYREQRELMASDPYRPLYHMSSLSNMGDANGLCHWQNRYHLFYQFVPEGSDRIHWGHCYSDNLVHWQDLPPALYPDTELHCFSGQTLVEEERVIALYHGKESGNSIATASDPMLLNWKKSPNNPVIPNVDANAPLHGHTRNGKIATASRSSRSEVMPGSYPWMCGRCGRYGLKRECVLSLQFKRT